MAPARAQSRPDTLRVVFAAGGTGGHVFPAMAVIDALRRRAPDAVIGYVGRREGLEAREAAKRNLVYLGVAMQGLRRRISTDIVVAPALSLIATIRCLFWLLKFQPHLVIGFGGYASWPALLAGVLLRRRTMLHEQNRHPGLANRLLAPWVGKVYVSDEGTKDSLPRAEMIGLPIRPGVRGRSRSESRAQWNLDPDRFTLLVFGGSGGAKALCEAAGAAFKQLDDRGFRYQALLQTGAKSYAEFKAREFPAHVQVVEFIEDMGSAYAAADLAVARAGAVSLAEITANGLPSILVPYPYATGRHQHENARSLEESGAAVMIDQNDLTGESLSKAIMELADNNKLRALSESSRRLGRPDAAEEFAGRILADAGLKKAAS